MKNKLITSVSLTPVFILMSFLVAPITNAQISTPSGVVNQIQTPSIPPTSVPTVMTDTNTRAANVQNISDLNIDPRFLLAALGVIILLLLLAALSSTRSRRQYTQRASYHEIDPRLRERRDYYRERRDIRDSEPPIDDPFR